MTPHNGPVFAVALFSDGKHALTGGADNTMRLWRLPDPGKEGVSVWNAPAKKEQEPDESSVAAALEKIGAGITRDGRLPGNPVVHINLTQKQVTDADLKDLHVFKNLQGLHLGVTGVTDAGVKHLKELKSLQGLNIPLTQVSDEGLKDLKDAPEPADTQSWRDSRDGRGFGAPQWAQKLAAP